jgi:hypothetical protein
VSFSDEWRGRLVERRTYQREKNTVARIAPPMIQLRDRHNDSSCIDHRTFHQNPNNRHQTWRIERYDPSLGRSPMLGPDLPDDETGGKGVLSAVDSPGREEKWPFTGNDLGVGELSLDPPEIRDVSSCR